MSAHDPRDDQGDRDDGGREAFERMLGRERREPEEMRNPIPRGLSVFALALIAWGAWYYFQNVDYPLTAGDRRTAIVRGAAGDVDGSAVYAANCVSCHQADGQGLAGVFPPLSGSRWVLGDETRLAQILLYGINGVIEVKGQRYQGVMPAFRQLDDGELAAVLSHIRSSWENDAAPIAPALIARERRRYPQREAPWQGGAALDEAFPPDTP